MPRESLVDQTFGGLSAFAGADPETAIASAATTNIGNVGSRRLSITGTTAITSFGSVANRLRFLRFADSLTLTHGVGLVLPGAQNIQTQAGDTCIADSDSGGVWRVRAYQRGNGAPFPNGFQGGFAGTPAPNQMVGGSIVVGGINFSTARSKAVAGFAATASTVFRIFRDGVQIGTITFAAGATAGTYNFTQGSASANQLLQILAPATPDATLADVTFLIRD